MRTPEELYVNGMKRQFKQYYAAWPPNEPLRLGDIGVIERNLFIRIKNLDAPEIDIKFKTREDTDSSMLDVQSASGVEVAVKAAGELSPNLLPNIPQAEAGLGVSFGKKGAFILKAPATYSPSIEDIDLLGKQVLDKYIHGQWNVRWVVIVRLVTAPRATILVSTSSQSKIEFKVSGDLQSGPIDLGNAKLSFNVASQNGSLVQSVGAVNVTPLFQVAGIKKNFLGIPDVGIKSLRDTVSPLDWMTPATARDDDSIGFGLIL